MAVLATGVGLGVALLLLAAVTFPAIRAHEARAAWTNTTERNARPAQDESRTDRLLWRARVDTYQGADIIRVDVAPLGPHSPLPPGLTAFPAPGQLVVSPAMSQLMRRVPADQLADRYPGTPVGLLGHPALVSPDSLVVVVGYTTDELRGRPAVVQVRSIESQPTTVSLTRLGRVVLGIGSAALLVPILVLISTATRLSAARREQRLAAMRLVGATPGQVRTIAVVEAATGALGGVALGFVLFAVSRPLAASLDIDGSRFFVSDLQLSRSAATVIGAGVPVLAATVALASLRRVQISPLGVARQAARRRPTWRRLLPLALALTGFAVLVPNLADVHGDWALWSIAAMMSLLIVGIVMAGPWLTLGVGRLLIASSRRTSTLLAGRRLANDPGAGFRSISGVVLAVFLVTVLSEATASAAAPVADPGQTLIPGSSVGAYFIGAGTAPLAAGPADALLTQLRSNRGVTGVLDLRWDGGSPPPTLSRPLPVVTRCADLIASGLGRCPHPAQNVGLDARLLGNGFLQGVGAPATDTPLIKLPLAGLLVLTDGRTSSMEHVRTTIETVTDSPWLPWTGRETKSQSNTQANLVNRIGNAALLMTLLVAGFSLAVSIAAGLIERKRPYTLLRLAGMRATELRGVLAAETVIPLLTITSASVGLGFAVSAEFIWVAHSAWRPPDTAYWATLGIGIVMALTLATTVTLPLLNRLTSPETARFE